MIIAFSIFIQLFSISVNADPINPNARTTIDVELSCKAGNENDCHLSRKEKAWEKRLLEYSSKYMRLSDRTGVNARYIPENLPDPANSQWFKEYEFFPKNLTLLPGAHLTSLQAQHLDALKGMRDVLRKIPILTYCEWDHHCRINKIKVNSNHCGGYLGYYYSSSIAGRLHTEIMDEEVSEHVRPLLNVLEETQRCTEPPLIQPVCKNFQCSAP